MSSQEEKQPKLSRRQFVAGAAASVAGGVLAGCAPKVAATQAAESAAPVAASARPFGYMCDTDWLGKPPVIADSDIATTVTFDVVICGGGHAGTQAALAAAQAGKTAAVIEIQPADKYVYKGDDICSYNSKFMLDKDNFNSIVLINGPG